MTYLKNTNDPELNQFLGEKGSYHNVLHGNKSEIKYVVNDNMDVMIIISLNKDQEILNKFGTVKMKDKFS